MKDRELLGPRTRAAAATCGRGRFEFPAILRVAPTIATFFRNAPSAVGISMTGSERPSPKPHQKKRPQLQWGGENSGNALDAKIHMEGVTMPKVLTQARSFIFPKKHKDPQNWPPPSHRAPPEKC